MTRAWLWAHRGAVGPDSHENSLAAFRRARAVGADGVELDARLTADGTVVLSHDPLVEDGRVGRLATLEEALAECGSMTVNVELKDLPHEPSFSRVDGLIDAVAALLGDHQGDVVVSSFHLPSLDRARAVLPEGVRTGWLTLPGTELESTAPAAADAGHHAVHPHLTSVTPSSVEAALALGLAVHVWTVNDPADARRMAAMGVTALITDDIPTLRAALPT